MSWFQSREKLAAFWAGLFAAIVLILAFVGTDAEVYLFPRIAAVCMALLAAMLIYGAIKGDADDDSNESIIDWGALLPGLAIGVLFVLLIETVGFYASSFVAFCGITMLYGKRKAFDPKALMYKGIVAAIFMAVLYMLFWNLLHVRTPTGFLL